MLIIALQWLIIKVPSRIDPGSTWALFSVSLIGPAVGLFGFLGVWLFFSRLPWRERWIGVLAFALPCAIVYPACHYTFVPIGIVSFALPFVLTAWLLWFLATPYLNWPVRRVGMAVVLALAWSFFIFAAHG